MSTVEVPVKHDPIRSVLYEDFGFDGFHTGQREVTHPVDVDRHRFTFEDGVREVVDRIDVGPAVPGCFVGRSCGPNIDALPTL